METVGKFEFSRKDLVGHGAFAVVFKGRHREKHDWEVAVKCINKKNLAKSQTLLGKEIKILKELKHENIVALHDFQETASSVYLVMEYCNGGDLADYLHSKGTLSEDTIRVFLQQIAGAMRVLQAKGIIHRDLKPQNILLSHPAGRKSHSNNTCIKIADFGFARHLQNNMMAATLCGSPMYMAPEVIMSQNYDAKADLWSIGTIVFQCLTGKAPFQASSPQDLRLFYEKNKTLSPNIPRETSSHLRHLLLGLLQRNHKDRMDFDEFFKHPFLEASSSMKKSAPVAMTCFPSSASASSCSSSSTSHLASPPVSQSLAEIQQVRAKVLASPTQDSPGFLLKDSGGGGGASSSKNSSCDTDDFVMVPAHFSSELTCEIPTGKVLQDSLMYSGSSLLASGGQCSQGKTPPISPSYSSSPGPSGGPNELSGSNYSNYGQSIPIPVPTQIHNYQRMEQNLHFPGQEGSPSPRSGTVQRYGSGSSLTCGQTGPSPPQLGGPGSALTPCRLSTGGAKPFQLSPQFGTIPELPGQMCTAGVEMGHRGSRGGETKARTQQPQGLGTRLNSAPCLLEATGGCRQKIRKQHSDPVVVPQGNMMPFRTLHSSPRLSELMQRSPLPTILGSPSRSQAMPPFEFPKPPNSPNMVTFLAQQGLRPAQGEPCLSLAYQAEEKRGFGRSQSAGRLSDVLLMAAFGGQRGDRGSMENLNSDRAMDITASPGSGAFLLGSGSPARVVFTVGSPPNGGTPPQSSRLRKYSGSSSSISPVGSLTSRYPQCMDGYEGPSSPRYGFTDPISANLEGAVTFEAPELPEETLMEQEHTEIVHRLRFMLDFARCMVEVAEARGGEAAQAEQSSIGLLRQQSLVADQISSLSREWSYAEQLVLYMKTAELLSSSLHTAMEGIKQGKLYPSTTVKQVVRRLNDLYKSSVMSCRSLSAQLERFFSRKHRLMDHINSITAERLLFSHTVQMVQTAALDEMFHQGSASVQRYHKALLLMEGLSLLLTEQADVLSISKCKQCIERRLTALQSGLCV
ncbi:serine/threonine-protein kinase ULK1-like isoform X2 [Myxocyprinus asiaticus]|uniref:serine/threonine-protein kinase ULK1-like isoform X2 n=1 Tax=Myxocyprinus asiaticus TaxID=70543 RepID=UPI0022212BC1|nr:serine/threonine-protein kinase ULK1-like isoform X2 [Myxocyprinus asiaticus]